MKVCSIEGCEKRVDARGWCSTHYKRWRVNGGPHLVLKAKSPNGAPMEFLMGLPLDGDGCVEWPYAKNSAGYGNISVDGKNRLASRISCERRNGPPPSPIHQAAHTCGRGHEGCVAPWHLRWKTPIENAADKVKHGTAVAGSNLPWAKLTEETAAEIRSLGGKMRQSDIAAKYGVSQPTVSLVLRGVVWTEPER